ncbi:MAG: hypothetical protein SA339_08290 [Methanomassiliicoccus sp.]|nr:hypothetical protein [Methanomassiliicoccus sp.]
MLIGLGMLGLFIITFIFPYPKTQVSSLLFLGMIALIFILFGLWGLEVARKHSCHAEAFGIHTSICTDQPMASVELPGAKDEDPHTFHLFLANGCQGPYYIKGGKKHGCLVVRDDCLVTIPGEETNVWIFSSPDWYKMNVRPGGKYKPFEWLPEQIKTMVQSVAFDPEGPIAVFWAPHENRKKLTAIQKEEKYFRSLWEQANSTISSLQKQLDSINKGSIYQAGAHERAMLASRGTSVERKRWDAPREEEEGVEER